MTGQNGSAVLQKESGTVAPQTHSAVYVSPRADVYETPDAYVLTLDMPGAAKERIAVSLEKDSLLVEADINTGLPDGGVKVRDEIRGNRFERSFLIGDGIQRDAVDARFENGVLIVKLFKAEDVKPREIAIH